ncbi:MAG: hypothetical protein ACRDQ4_02900 [Pseudonocardiaceae bacterium]
MALAGEGWPDRVVDDLQQGVFCAAGTSWTRFLRVLRVGGQYNRHPLVPWDSCATCHEVHSGL